MKLIFVYNADSGMFNQVVDAVHKLVSPGTYKCNLCKLTYGNVSMKKEWADFIKTFTIPLEFLHRDELHAAYPSMKDVVLPVVFLLGDNGDIKEFIFAEKINTVSTIGEIKELVKGAVENI